MTTSPGSSSSSVMSTKRLTILPFSSNVRYAVNLSMGLPRCLFAPLARRKARRHHVLPGLHLGQPRQRARELEHHCLVAAVDVALADREQLVHRCGGREQQLDAALV